ncbi:TetR family transcriptional regulator [Streptomyces sp. BK208]|uniref:TetR/AcrR family transcriptional regulator n=1 Tax=Streptomyces sp. BK208 TaxID=2512150 RepID=UPI00105F26FC|nr:TetR/AcrR family transcriptional regulator C-terminal domain-containing protein [Streptomyces sp. BK208]TDT42705.1 TetR family transcriptional regulator [Streptomyces sp. BK208]
MRPNEPGATGRRRIGRPSRLSQEVIVEAAQRIVDTEGDGSLSMRRLARELSITPMALYHHVRDRDQLLRLLLETKARSQPRPVLPEDPRERLTAAALLLHDVLAGCPFLSEILTSDDLMDASALWVVEAVLEAALACGFTVEEASGLYQAVAHYTVGELLIRLTRERHLARLDRPPYRAEALGTLLSQDHPRLFALADRWSELTARDTHRAGLQAVLGGFLRTLDQGGSQEPAPA